MPDPRGAGLNPAFQFSHVRSDGPTDLPTEVRLLRSNFGLYTFVRDKGTKGQRDKGTKGQRDKGTKGQSDKGTLEILNFRTWKLENMGTWKLGNLGT